MKQNPEVRSDRIAIESKLHDTYKELSSGDKPEFAPFQELKDVFLTAACLGFQRGKRRRLSADRRDIVRWETLSGDDDVPVVHALAIADTGSVEVLADKAEVLTIAEEYANEGIHVLLANIKDRHVRPLWGLVDMMRAEAERNSQGELTQFLVGEGSQLEYKSSMRWDREKRSVNRDLERAVAKTVAAFLNSEGGSLLIGVADDSSVVGIEHDLKTLGRKDRDGYEQKLRQVVNDCLGTEFSKYQHVSFEGSAGMTVCILGVERSPKPVYLKQKATSKQKGTKEFYIRSGNTTQPLDVEAAHDYIAMHWPT